MTERKKLKKELARLKRYRSNLPRLISCSLVYGDKTYTNEDLIMIDRFIEGLKRKINTL
jgi:hypothetical protein